jgi:PAS domain S-box-containing protein
MPSCHPPSCRHRPTDWLAWAQAAELAEQEAVSGNPEEHGKMETAQASSRKRTARRRPRAQQNRSASPLGETVCRSMVELAPDAIVVADGNGRIVLLNQQAEILFGAARAALLRQPIECLMPARFHTRHEQHRSHYQAAPRPRPMGTSLALFGQRQDGSEFPVEVSLSPLQVGDELLIINTIRDITARRALEAQAQAHRA